MLFNVTRRSNATIVEQMRKPIPTISPFEAKGSLVHRLLTLKAVICNDRSPCCNLVKLYAKMGLHRYNLFQGTNYQLILVKKYHYRLILAASTYYITLVAMDPSTSLLHTFQTKIDEGQIAGFVLKCNIARIRAETNKDERAYSCYFPGSMPEWPTEDPFDNRKRFYVLNKSEVQDNDWIRLYLELAVAKYRSINMDPDLSDLKIVNVAIDTSQDLSEGLNAKNATVYISYKDSCEARVGKDVDRIAIVRRTFCERTRQFTLRGRHQSLEIIPKKRADQGEDDSCEAGVGEDADRVRSSSSEHTRRLSPMCQQNLSSDKKCKYQRVIRPRLSVLKKWRFLSPRRHKACKNHGVGLARPLHKTRSI